MQLRKRLTLMIMVLGIAFPLSGCMSQIFPGWPTPAGGLITSVKSPTLNLAVAKDRDASIEKTGTSTVGAFLGLFAFGDGSIEAAMKNGGITKVHHVDHEVTSFLFGIWMQDKTFVYGE